LVDLVWGQAAREQIACDHPQCGGFATASRIRSSPPENGLDIMAAFSYGGHDV
jgi:hypothetical protein